VTEPKPNEEKPGAIAYAKYETKGTNSVKADAYVRPSIQAEELFTFENSFGEEHQGTLEEVAQLFAASDRSMQMKGYVRMGYGNLSGKQAFDL
jgi:hypothetical protein